MEVVGLLIPNKFMSYILRFFLCSSCATGKTVTNHTGMKDSQTKLVFERNTILRKGVRLWTREHERLLSLGTVKYNCHFQNHPWLMTKWISFTNVCRLILCLMPARELTPYKSFTESPVNTLSIQRPYVFVLRESATQRKMDGCEVWASHQPSKLLPNKRTTTQFRLSPLWSHPPSNILRSNQDALSSLGPVSRKHR